MNAEESGIKVTDREIEIANNNVGLSYAKLGKPQWARVWFLRDKDSKISQYNLKQLPKPHITQRPTRHLCKSQWFWTMGLHHGQETTK